MAKEFRLLFFDTEMSDSAHIVSLGYVVTDCVGNQLSEGYFIVKPVAPIKKATIAIHGITTAMAKEKGISLNKALRIFENAIQGCNVISGYAVKNDLKVLALSCMFMKRKTAILSGYSTVVDVARLAESYLASIGLGHPGETPSLEHIYSVLFGENFNTHNALDDAKATARCFWELQKRHPFDLHAIIPYSQIHYLFVDQIAREQAAKEKKLQEAQAEVVAVTTEECVVVAEGESEVEAKPKAKTKRKRSKHRGGRNRRRKAETKA